MSRLQTLSATQKKKNASQKQVNSNISLILKYIFDLKFKKKMLILYNGCKFR